MSRVGPQRAGSLVGMALLWLPNAAWAQGGPCSAADVSIRGDLSGVDVADFEAQFRATRDKACD